MLSDVDRKTLQKFNDTKGPFLEEKTIQELFEEQVLISPDKIALKHNDQEITYRELSYRSSKIANKLVKQGVAKDEFVGLLAERSIELIIGLLGILKSGSAFVPIDPINPKSRIKFILENSGANVLLINGAFNEYAEYCHLIDLRDNNIYDSFDSCEKARFYKSDDLAYMTYTSGSTGNPKGVMIEHKSVVNFIQGIKSRIGVDSNDIILWLTSISFDIFLLESLLPITIGGKVILVGKEDQMNPKLIADLILRNRVTILQLTPSRLKVLLSDEDTVKAMNIVNSLLVGGEELTEHLLNEIKFKLRIKAFNMYGPTETTVWSTIRELENVEKVDIGSPIINTEIYIINPEQELLPIGEIGELCIAGVGLARGYFKQPILNNDKFISNPFKEGERLYKTGDLARWLPCGNIQFIGRIDNQVKVRGYRIELEEIESILIKHPEVKDVVVVVKSDFQKEKVICAYYVSQQKIDYSDLRLFLEEFLPEYMLPTFFERIDFIPLNINGKLDKDALPFPCRFENSVIAPQNDIQAKILNIWAELLGVEKNKISIDQSFIELGGHSIRKVQLLSRIQKEYNIILSISDLNENSNIKEISKLIYSKDKEIISRINPVEKRDYYELSYEQEELIDIYNKYEGASFLNYFFERELHPAILLNQVKSVFLDLFSKYSLFRTSFCFNEHRIIQRVEDKPNLEILTFDLKHTSKWEILYEFYKPFNLSVAPLVRVGIVNNILMISFPSILMDKFSIVLLINKLYLLIKGEEISKPRINYSDYAVWQNSIQQRDKLKFVETFWQQVFNENPSSKKMPYILSKDKNKKYAGKMISFSLNEGTVSSCLKMAANEGVTLHVFLISAFSIFVSRICEEEDVIIISNIFGRRQCDVENILGPFDNTVLLRNSVSPKLTFLEFMQNTNDRFGKVFDNQEYPIRLLREKILNGVEENKIGVRFDAFYADRDYSYNENNRIGKQRIDDIQLATDFEVQTFIYKENLNFHFRYNSNYFNEATVKHFVFIFSNIIDIILQNKDIKLGEIHVRDNF